MDLTSLFEELGTSVAADWRAASYAYDAFPRVAERALRRVDPSQHVDFDALMHWASHSDGPLRIYHTFSDAAFVVYSDDADGHPFEIEVLTWLDGSNKIHDHIFAGAFQVLQGGSLQTEYAFAPEEALHADLEFGSLTLQRARRLTQGDIQRILPARGLIHRLFHLEAPSQTIVIRSMDASYTVPGAYMEAGIAYRVRDDAQLEKLNHVSRLRSMRGDLALAAEFRDIVMQLDAYQAFEFLRPRYGIPAFEADARALIGERFGAHAARIQRAFEQQERTDRLKTLRAEVRDADHRYLLALLMSFDDRDQIFEFVRDKSSGPFQDNIANWICQLSGTPGFLEVSDDTQPILALMCAAPDSRAFLATLREEFGEQELQESRHIIDGLVETLNASPLAPLLWDDLSAFGLRAPARR